MVRISGISQPLASEIRKSENSRRADTDGKTREKSTRADTYKNSSDSAEVSNEGAEAQVVKPYAIAQPDVREDRVAEVREKIRNGFYSTPEFIDNLAENLIKEFGITPEGK